ncbi:MAG TPA: hypothetical protein VME17_11115, partial [Bryobacteraceae bacterium]|nr:hypothetical protein [Bryobacteraceae bacterium]
IADVLAKGYRSGGGGGLPASGVHPPMREGRPSLSQRMRLGETHSPPLECPTEVAPEPKPSNRRIGFPA